MSATTTAGPTAVRRQGAEADAVTGVVPGTVVRPPDVEAVRALLREAAAEQATVVPVGSGSKTDWAAPPSSCDVRLDLTGLDALVEHTAGDLVVVAQAGMRLDALQARLAEAGQQLGLDPPEAGATLGGVLSANASGPRRLRYGTVRDLLIGVTVVLPDATVAASGGKVVKNVAGYDLGKLYTGAHGSLGVVVSTTWRLHPLAPASGVVVVPVRDAAEAGRCAQLLVRSTLTPSAVELLAPAGGEPSLVVLFESIPESVQAQAEATVALLGAGTVVEDLPAGFGRRPGDADQLVLRLAYEPFALPAALDALPDTASVTASAGTGVAYVALPAEQGAAALPGLRAALAAYDGTAVVLSAPPAVRDRLDHWGPVGDTLDLMRRLKDRFDPERRLSPGRFVGGL